MENTLYLTASEKEIYDRLPADVRDEWQVVEEVQTSYETDDELRMRAKIARFDYHPNLKNLLADIQNGSAPRALDASILDFPAEAIPELCFTIGARGITLMMEAGLNKATVDDDVDGIAALSIIRHGILETNASISYT